MNSLVIASAINNQEILENNLLRSPLLARNQATVFLQKDSESASKAYNQVLDKADADLIVFVHQDVYIPSGWHNRLQNAISQIGKHPWAVIGIIGKTHEGEVVGRTWSTGIGREVGCRINSPEPVEYIDELLIVVNRKSCIVFDDELPGFHLYGTDIVQTALSKGYNAYVIDAPVIHNSLPYVKFGKDFVIAYKYMQNKWRKSLPLNTLVANITPWGWSLKKRLIKQLFKQDRREYHKRLDYPAEKAKELGYE